jgi:hypothetical protein
VKGAEEIMFESGELMNLSSRSILNGASPEPGLHPRPFSAHCVKNREGEFPKQYAVQRTSIFSCIVNFIGIIHGERRVISDFKKCGNRRISESCYPGCFLNYLCSLALRLGLFGEFHKNGTPLPHSFTFHFNLTTMILNNPVRDRHP